MLTIHVSGNIPGLLFSSSISVVVIGLMLFMAVRLYAGNRRRAYRTLLISLGFIFIYHLMQLALAVGWLPRLSELTFAGKLLQVLAFIVMNFAVFELYYRRRPRTRMWFFVLIAFALLVAVGDVMTGAAGDVSDWSERLSHTPVLDGYLLMLSPLFALMFGPHISQKRKYALGLSAAFAAQTCAIAYRFAMPESAGLQMLAELLQIVYYVLLFMLLFERVVELLMTAYRSSITDGLTNLYNRRYFTAQLEKALRSGKAISAIFCDIDNFKRLNDTQGHHKADGVLKQVSTIVAEETEGAGIAGRYGGEELVAFVAGPPQTAKQAAEAIRRRTEKESIVTISVGLCTMSPGISMSAEALMKRADVAMYYSKTNGKNRVTDYASLRESDKSHERKKS